MKLKKGNDDDSTQILDGPWFTYYCYWLEKVNRKQALVLSWIEAKVEKAQKYHYLRKNVLKERVPKKIKAGWVLLDYKQLNEAIPFFSVPALKKIIRTLVNEEHLDYKEKQITIPEHWEHGVICIPDQKITKRWVRVANDAMIESVKNERDNADRTLRKLDQIDRFDVWSKNKIYHEHCEKRKQPYGFPIQYDQIRNFEDADSLILFSWVKRLNDIHHWYKGKVQQVEKTLKMKRTQQWKVIQRLIKKGKLPPQGRKRQLVSRTAKMMLAEAKNDRQ